MSKQNNRWFICCLLSIVMCLSIIVCSNNGDIYAEDNNLLLNGSFEQGEAPWKPENWNVDGGACIEVNEGARTGNTWMCLRFEWENYGIGFVTMSQEVDVKANTDYLLSLYVKKYTTGGEDVPMYVGYRNPNGADPFANIKDIQITNIGTEWQQVKLSFNTGALTRINVAAFVQSRAFSGVFCEYLVDDVSLVEVVHDGGLLKNATFESGSQWAIDNWDIMGGACLETMNDGPHSGTNWVCLRYEWEGYGKDFVTISQKVAVEKGKYYEFSFYAKKYSTGGEDVPMYVGYRNPNGAEPFANIKDIQITNIGTEWAKYSFLFNSGDLTEITVAAFVCSRDYTGFFAEYLIDDASLVEIPEVQCVAQRYEGVYDGQAHTISVTSTTSGAVVYYSENVLNADNYIADGSTVAPTLTEAGIKKVYYYVALPGYIAKSGSVDIVITKADSILTIECNGVTYGNVLSPSVIENTSGAEVKYVYYEDADGVKGSRLSAAPENAGVYWVEASTDATDNYNSAISKAVKLEILKADYDMSSVSFADATFDYDATEHNVAIVGLPQGVSVAYENNSQINAGNYTVTAKFTGDTNHNQLPEMTATLVINKITATVTAKPATKTVGETDPVLKYEVVGLVGQDKLTGALARQSGETEGEYDITLGTLFNQNYDLQFVGAKFTVKEKTATTPDGDLDEDKAFGKGCFGIVGTASIVTFAIAVAAAVVVCKKKAD